MIEEDVCIYAGEVSFTGSGTSEEERICNKELHEQMK